MNIRRKISARLRRQVSARAQERCEYCQAPEAFSLDTFEIDHVQPIADAGSDEPENLAFACPNCNNRKQEDRTVLDAETGHVVPLYNPRNDVWSSHFYWSEDALTVLPLTATGRATDARLKTNRPGVINIRRALIALGETHPPPTADAD